MSTSIVVVNVIDTIAIKSAACSALSDPCVTIDGRVYPSVYSVAEAQIYDGRNEEGTEADSVTLQTRIAANCSAYCDAFVAHIAWLFGLKDGEKTASHMLAAMFQHISGGERHLRMKVAAPFYWIEPTSLFSTIPTCTAQDAGYGVIVATGCGNKELPVFHGMHVKQSNSQFSYIVADWTSARLHGAVLHHQVSARDGLGAITVQQASYNSFVLRGGIDESIDASVTARRNLDQYLWRRADAGVPAPAELVYTASCMMLRVVHYTLNDEMEVTSTGFKNFTELDTKYFVKVGKPFNVRL